MTQALVHNRDLLRLSDLDGAGLEHLLDLAARMKEEPNAWSWLHRERAIACLFEKPSTRTRVSLERAAQRLGMSALILRGDELQLGRGETIADTARVLSSYVDAIAVRTFAHAALEELAAHATVPVVNALSDSHHPLQALADLLTIRERVGHLLGMRVAFVGPGTNVAHSLAEACALAGATVAIASPPEYGPDPALLAAARGAAARLGADVEVHTDPREAVRGADAVYTDVWVSMGEEAERAARSARLEPYRVTARLMDLAHRDAIFLHCLPAHRGEEVEAAVIDGPRSAVFQQAANRLPTTQAVLHAVLGGVWD